ncbi:hypothetical protein ScPMuIL_004231 [Solemya velum]
MPQVLFIINIRHTLKRPPGFRKRVQLLIIGLDNAGKSTLLDRIQSGRMIQHPPTNLPRSKEMELGNMRFLAYDLGGHPQARRVWRDYFPAVDAIVFIVDASDAERFAEAQEELDGVLHDETIAHVPVLVLGNKVDRPDSVGEDHMSLALGLGIYRTGKAKKSKDLLESRPVELFMCSCLKQFGYGDGFRWLGGVV